MLMFNPMPEKEQPAFSPEKHQSNMRKCCFKHHPIKRVAVKNHKTNEKQASHHFSS